MVLGEDVMSVKQEESEEPVEAQAIIFTNSAASKVKKLVAEEDEVGLMLRVFVTGGGCSGFQYGFTFDANRADDDTVIINNSAVLVVDALSFQYLIGAEVDYVEGLEGARFMVNNPNATATCGCGASFTI